MFDLGSNALRPDGWTSADAAGLPIFPGLVRYDEVVEQGEIRHALRFTVRTRGAPTCPPRVTSPAPIRAPTCRRWGCACGSRRALTSRRFPPSARVILQALQTYGMMVADNGGNWFISGAPDARWNDAELNTLKQVAGSNFEVVDMGSFVKR